MLRINQQCNRFLFSPANLTLLAWLIAGSAHLDRDMFSLMWGPTVAAVSIVLDHAEDMSTVRQALEGLLQAAKLGAYHHVDEVGLPNVCCLYGVG